MVADGEHVCVTLLNVGRREVILDGGQVIPMTELYDSDGEEWDDENEDEPVCCVAGPINDDGTGWITVDLREFTDVKWT